jgi:hypothetical protein
MIDAEVREVSPTARRNRFGETRRARPEVSAGHRTTRPVPAGLEVSPTKPLGRAYVKGKRDYYYYYLYDYLLPEVPESSVF